MGLDPVTLRLIAPQLKAAGEAMGIPHVEASPLTRSSYHARQAADAARSHEAVS